MVKDFSDYILTVYGAGERVYDDIHVRVLKQKVEGPTRNLSNMPADQKREFVIVNTAKVPAFELRSFQYKFEDYRDRAYRTKMTPWKKWYPKRPIWSLREFLRSKKVGHLHYLEPCSRECKKCLKKKDCPVDSSDVEPVHISKIHQPSGRLESTPMAYVEENGKKIISLLEQVTPFTFKTVIDNKFYMSAYKSFKFGFRATLKGNWWIYALIIGVVALVGFLFIGGYIPMG